MFRRAIHRVPSLVQAAASGSSSPAAWAIRSSLKRCWAPSASAAAAPQARTPALGGAVRAFTAEATATGSQSPDNVVRFVDEDGNENYGIIVEAEDEDAPAQVKPIQYVNEAWTTMPTSRRVGRFLPPLEPCNIFCVGLNYWSHAHEVGMEPPKFPVVFMKPTTTVTAHMETVVLPKVAHDEVDFEGELAVIIGRDCKDVTPVEAMDHVLGYTIANDVTARKWQGKKGSNQWCRAKAFDKFLPLGPGIVPANKVDPHTLHITTKVNGEVVQHESTEDMIWGIGEIISFLSQDTTLQHGTIILTGTPGGVGFTRKPPSYLKDGDVVEVSITNIGTLRNTFVAAPEEGDDA